MVMEVPGTRPRGRPKRSWLKNIKKVVHKWSLIEEDVYELDR